MASGWTEQLLQALLGWGFRGATIPTNFYVALVTSAVAPTVETETLGTLTEIAAGNGYTTGGYQLTPNGTDFDTLTIDEANDAAYVQIKDMVWTASGGSIPGSGSGASYAVLTDDNVTVGSRVTYGYWDLTSARTVSDGQTLTLENAELRIAG